MIAQLQVPQSHFLCGGLSRTRSHMDSGAIVEALKRLGVRHDRIAEAIGRDRTAATKMLAGRRAVKATEVSALTRLIAEAERDVGEMPIDTNDAEYLPVELLPSFAGMGGGGTGDDDPGTGLVSRRMIEDELRAKASDMLLIEARGESMAPDFLHGDQILIDKRDKNPLQPGAFALWDGDGYVVKLVERVPRKSGVYRIFSANPRFQEYEVDAEEVTILGRPVWFARRL
jgi:phage repressor protein C with HTH and peptisase S24 domain